MREVQWVEGEKPGKWPELTFRSPTGGLEDPSFSVTS